MTRTQIWVSSVRATQAVQLENVMKQEKIGFVGVGLMGHGMAKNIMAGGYDLTVIAHRSRASVDDLLSHGANEAKDLAALAQACDIIHTCAPGSPQVETIIAVYYRACEKAA